MKITIRQLSSLNSNLWDNYVERHPQANYTHLSLFKDIIKNTYGHKTHYLFADIAKKGDKNPEIVGILPLIYMNSFLFEKSLISIPFFDMGGILSDSRKVEEELIKAAIGIGKQLNVAKIELRQTTPINSVQKDEEGGISFSRLINKTQKVRMLLEFSGSSQDLLKSFKAKLRSQIKKPIKEGLIARIGGQELLADFYKVFSINMRDLGSPVHSKKMIAELLKAFAESAQIVVVYHQHTPVAASVMVGYKDTLENPWASALRQYSRMAPNMLLYWKMLEFACDNGYRFFDFGRSSPEEGTFRFKKQWGAIPHQLYWYSYNCDDKANYQVSRDEKSKFDTAIRFWQKLPVPASRIIGPSIRKHISL